MRGAFHGRVEINLADPVGQMREEPQDPLLDHAAAPGQAEDVVVGGEPGASKSATQCRDPRLISRKPIAFIGKGAPKNFSRLRGDAHGSHTVVAADLDDQGGDCRVQLHVLVGIHMIERQTSRPERVELSPDLFPELLAHLRQKEKPDTSAPQVPIELVGPAEEAAHLRRRQHRTPVDQHQMQADMQFGQSPRARNRIGGGGGAYHQARGRQDPVAMRLFDGLIDGRVEPEIVGADDQPFQPAISRLRRNWKNSAPSRRRRRSICGLLTISATKEAIFLRRK